MRTTFQQFGLTARSNGGLCCRRQAAVIGFCLAALCAARPAYTGEACVPPPNETCDGAFVFTTSDLPYSVTAPLGCVNNVIDKPYFDVFYRYDCTVTAEHFIDMCDSAGDAFLRIYTEGCGWADGEELAVADDECPGSPPNADPQLIILLEAGQSYWFELGPWRPDPPWAPPLNSPYNFNVSLLDQPPADPCDGVGLDMVLVGNPGNAADATGRGAIDRLYRVGTFEVTNPDYVEFLNAVAKDDPNGLFNQNMEDSDRGGILRAGSPGTFTYFTKEHFSNKPVNWIGWPDCARYCNWLHNGKPAGTQDASTTETGAYDMTLPNDQIVRQQGARWYLPTHDEWYKAAYHDPIDPGADGGGTPDYWNYPTRSDTLPTKAQDDAVGDVTNPGPNVANYDKGANWNGENGNVTTVGGTTSVGPWGTFDMGGNINEWTETPDTPIPPNPPDQPEALPTRSIRGSDFASPGILMSTPEGFALALNMVAEAANIGYRVAAELCQGDFDGDNDIDDDDFAAFEPCFTGPDGGPLDALCAPGDFDGDGDIDCEDWEQLVAAWTGAGDPPSFAPCKGCPADFNGDGSVGAFDLAIVLGSWGPCEGCPTDFNDDGVVDAFDLAILLGSWGPCS